MATTKEFDVFHKNLGFKSGFYSLNQRSLFDLRSIKDAFSVVSSLPDYSETPLIQMTGMAKTLGIATLHCKYEGERFGGSSFKSLGLSNAVINSVALVISKSLNFNIEVADLINGKFKENTKSLTFSAATSGNHGYALAWISRQLGAKAKIYVPGDVSKNRISRILSLGAEVIVVEGNFDDAVEACNLQSHAHGDVVISNEVQEGFEQVPKQIMNGYGIIAKEISTQLTGITPTHIFVGGGGGRLAASIAAFYSIESRFGSPKIVVVEPEKSDCIFQSLRNRNLSVSSSDADSIMTGLVVKKPSPIAWEILEHNAFASIRISDVTAIEVLTGINKGLYGDRPIAVGETGIAAMAGLVLAARSTLIRSELEIDDESNIVAIACEGVIDQDLLDFLLAETKIASDLL